MHSVLPPGLRHLPMDLTRVLEQPQRYTVDWRITPSLIEESSSSVKMVEVILVSLTPPETHICDFKVGPEVARRVTIGLVVMFWPPHAVRNPPLRIIFVEVFWVLGHEFDGFGP